MMTPFFPDDWTLEQQERFLLLQERYKRERAPGWQAMQLQGDAVAAMVNIAATKWYEAPESHVLLQLEHIFYPHPRLLNWRYANTPLPEQQKWYREAVRMYQEVFRTAIQSLVHTHKLSTANCQLVLRLPAHQAIDVADIESLIRHLWAEAIGHPAPILGDCITIREPAANLSDGYDFALIGGDA